MRSTLHVVSSLSEHVLLLACAGLHLPISSVAMKYRLAYEAVITIQHARIHPLELYGSSSSSPSTNPYVHIGIMVPKGSKDVTVPTNCATRVLRRTNDPVWNQTFCLPVMPNSDVLVLQVFDHRASNLAERWSSVPSAPQRSQLFGRQSDSYDGDDDDDDEESFASSVHTITGKEESEKIPNGELIGVCLLPVARIPPNETISRHAMDIFPSPTEPSVGRLFIATKMQKKSIPMLTKEDISDPAIIGQFHSTRLLAAESRFLGIGELAAFLFEEGYSTSPTENWDRAVTMLAQQLAFRMFQIKSSDKEDTKQYMESLKDDENFEKAKRRIEKEGGLWDGL